MAKPAAGGKMGGEILQIAILTSFMTGGLLALISAAFYFFIIPGKLDALNRQIKDHNDLLGLLSPARKDPASKEVWNLRARWLEATKNPMTKSLREIVQENLGNLQWTSFPQTAVKRGSGGKGPVEYNQNIDLKEAPLFDILSFCIRIKSQNPSVHIGHINMSRKLTRSLSPMAAPAAAPADDDRWTGKVEFSFFGSPAAPAAAKGAPPSKEASPEEGAPPADESPSTSTELIPSESPETKPEEKKA